jgi:maleylpyruvate isomerase
MLELIDAATQRLLLTVRGLSDADVREPSTLPGWTRGHVLSHLARGAEAVANLLDGVRTGVPGQAYASPQARDDAIDAGSGRDVVALLADLVSSAERFRTAAGAVPVEAWERPVVLPAGSSAPATQLLVRRLVELELHHADLAAGYGPRDWPEAFVVLELDEPMRSQREERLAAEERPTPG